MPPCYFPSLLQSFGDISCWLHCQLWLLNKPLPLQLPGIHRRGNLI